MYLHKVSSALFLGTLFLAGLATASRADEAGSQEGVGTGSPRPASDLAVAIVDGTPIRSSELEALTEEKLASAQHQYEQQLRQLQLSLARNRSQYIESELNKLIDDRVLALEAAQQKTTASALLDQVPVPEVSDAAMRDFYNAQMAQLGQPYETTKPQIEQYLARQYADEAKEQYLQSLRQKYATVVSWEPAREQVAAIGPRRGPANAPVTIIEFSDFQCPYCGRLAPILRQLLATYPKQVAVVFRNNPLTNLHPDALRAAEAGVCADLQGKFWAFHDLAYAEQGALGVDDLKDKAKRAGLNTPQFDACLDSSKAADRVKADQDLSNSLGLTVTPSSFMNGRFVSGALPLYKWKALVDDELHRQGQR